MKFEKKVKQIAEAERDVDKVLHAAKLQRNPQDNSRLEMILTFIGLMLGMFSFYGFFIVMTILRG